MYSKNDSNSIMPVKTTCHWECSVSVKCECLCIKDEPELYESSSACPRLEKTGGQTECGVSAEVPQTTLYAEHEVKGELVLGPTVLQPPDAALTPPVAPEAEQIPDPTAQEKIHTEEKPNKCEICLKLFTTVKDFIVHKINHIAKTKKPFQCEHCFREFPNKSSFIIHERIHTGEKPYKCEICSKQFSQSGNLLKHKYIHTNARDQSKQYKCEICPRQFSRRCFLSNHLRMHKNKKPKDQSKQYKCDICPRQFSKRGFLINHLKMHRNKMSEDQSKQYKCDICPRQFSKRGFLINHLIMHRNKMSEEQSQQYKCDICPRQFSRRCFLSNHLRMHKNKDPKDQCKQYKCDICPRQFSKRGFLINHLIMHRNKMYEEQSKQYKCDICLRQFSKWGFLINHLKMHRNKMSEEQSQQYKCDICRRQFSKRGFLMNHLIMHRNKMSEEQSKQYKCDICPRQFSKRGFLFNHLRMHRHKNPFKCEICSKQFSRKVSLIAHKRFHTRKNPHKCDICQKRFSQRSVLLYHNRIHTRESVARRGRRAASHPVQGASHSEVPRTDRDSEERGLTDGNSPTSRLVNAMPQKVFVCDVCKEKFTQKSSLAEHILGQCPVCALCGARFEQRALLLRHASRHIWTPIRPEVSSGMEAAEEASHTVERGGSAEPAPSREQLGLRACSVRLQRLPPDAHTNSAVLSARTNRRTNHDTSGVASREQIFYEASHEELRTNKLSKEMGLADADLPSSGLDPGTPLHDTEPKDPPARELCVCGKYFKQKSRLIRHIRLHHSDLVHNEQTHSAKLPYECGTPRLRANRQINHDNKPKDPPARDLCACDACGKYFLGKRSLVSHIRFHHSHLVHNERTLSAANETLRLRGSKQINHDNEPKEPPSSEMYVCDVCLKVFTRKLNLIRHIRNHSSFHSNKENLILIDDYAEQSKPYQCGICQERLSYKRDLLLHKSLHKGKQLHRCKICQKQFTTIYYLHTHEIIHTEKRRYECKYCPKQFMDKRRLLQHEENHTQGTRVTYIKCLICLEKFSTRSLLAVHKTIHTEKPHKCKLCLKPFALRSGLLKHERNHTQEKRYECEICLKRFIHKYHLKRHVIGRHAKVRPYKCEICQERFTRKEHLLRHEKLTHYKPT